MSKISRLEIGEVVYVRSADETGPVVKIDPPTITVQLLTRKVEVHEDDFEKR